MSQDMILILVYVSCFVNCFTNNRRKTSLQWLSYISQWVIRYTVKAAQTQDLT